MEKSFNKCKCSSNLVHSDEISCDMVHGKRYFVVKELTLTQLHFYPTTITKFLSNAKVEQSWRQLSRKTSRAQAQRLLAGTPYLVPSRFFRRCNCEVSRLSRDPLRR
ncbi:hypothetical protein K0M31_017110 [Melipona bicolor]|uniref:Uncharacterized protein n=1 Tax=Melipona bicolor TaxID=60889 RepID=A0AA40FDI2_9HYME|nr:hypothetical protein K0M31_017110 [Melipona bicolor]